MALRAARRNIDTIERDVASAAIAMSRHRHRYGPVEYARIFTGRRPRR